MRHSLTPNKPDTCRRFAVHKRRRTGWDSNDRRIAHAHSDKIVDSDLFYNFTAYDYDGNQLIMERKWDCHIACYAYGPFGPISRTKLDGDAPCVRWLLSDGRGTTSGAADDGGNIQIQHFDAFGIPLETAVVSTCPHPNCYICQRGQRTTGELGYHGQEGYKTPMYDARRNASLPNAAPNHPDHNAAYPEGYESPSRALMQVGARDYDPYAGRFLQPDPDQTGLDLNWGQLNRWTYCANDPVNRSDPTGHKFIEALAILLIIWAGYDLTVNLIAGFTTGFTWTIVRNIGIDILSISLGVLGFLPRTYALINNAADQLLVDFLVFWLQMAAYWVTYFVNNCERMLPRPPWR